MSDEAGKEKRSVGVGHILRSNPQIAHEVPRVIQRHDDHGEPAQDVHGSQAWSLNGKRSRFRPDGGGCRNSRGSHHERHVQAQRDVSFIAAS